MAGITDDGTAYECRGEGPPVVLVHGLGLTRALWQWLTPDLEARFRLVTYDLLGHGESADPLGEPGLAMLARQTVRLLDHMAIEKAAVVGFSLGGMIARRFALDHPQRTTALAILNSAHDRSPAERDAVRRRVEEARRGGPAATVEAALGRWFSAGFRARHPETLALVRGWVMANRPEVYPRLYRVLAEGDAELAQAVGAIAVPTLVMTGGEDAGNSPDMARRMAAAIPGAKVAVVGGLAHMGLAEDPRRFNAPLVAFLEETLIGRVSRRACRR